MLEDQGAKDIIVKQEEYDTPNGLKGMKAYGSLSIENPITNKLQKSNYQIITFNHSNAVQQVVVYYQDGDSYAEKLVKRVLESIELKKSEE